MQDPYQTMGVPAGVDDETLRKRYLELVREFPPEKDPEKFAEIASMMGAETNGLTRSEAADKWFEEIEKLLKDLGIKSGHLNEQFGLEKKDLAHIVNLYSKDWCMQGNPREFNYDECMMLLENML